MLVLEHVFAMAGADATACLHTSVLSTCFGLSLSPEIPAVTKHFPKAASRIACLAYNILSVQQRVLHVQHPKRVLHATRVLRIQHVLHVKLVQRIHGVQQLCIFQGLQRSIRLRPPSSSARPTCSRQVFGIHVRPSRGSRWAAVHSKEHWTSFQPRLVWDLASKTSAGPDEDGATSSRQWICSHPLIPQWKTHDAVEHVFAMARADATA